MEICNKRLIRYFPIHSFPPSLFFHSQLTDNVLNISPFPNILNPSSRRSPSNTNLRHQLHANPASQLLFPTISSAGLPTIFSVKSPISESLTSLASYRCSHSFYNLSFGIGLVVPHGQFRLLSTSSSGKITEYERKGIVGSDKSFRVSSDHISEIVGVIRSGGDDLECKLNLIGISTSVESLSGIFRGLNSEGVSGLRLFAWALSMDPSLYHSADVCSLIIGNCGWLSDYGTMFRLLKEFSSRQICLNEKAFGFLPFLGSNKASMLESIRRVVNLLNEVGGSCLGSGICGLLKMLSKLDLFDLAKFVMEITDRRVPYYNILILEICQRRCFEEAHGMIEEMRQFGCDPDSRTYNYLLSSLCKHDRTAEVLNVFREMQNKGCPPDSLTYEIVIYFLCRLGKLDIAGHFYDMMVSRGLEPRLATFTTLIEGYFKSGRYEDAYKYVVASGDKFWHSGNRIYSFLADLYRRKGHLMTAAKILIEMMDKGLIPEFPVYMTITKRVYKCGGGQLASDLKSRFTRLRYRGQV